MKNKLLSLSLLALTLLGSCSSKVLSKEEYITLGKQITSEFKAPTAKSYKANFELSEIFRRARFININGCIKINMLYTMDIINIRLAYVPGGCYD